jgi:hypothetical protein
MMIAAKQLKFTPYPPQTDGASQGIPSDSLLSRLPYGGFLFQLRGHFSVAKLIPSVTHDMGIGMEYSEQPNAL